MDLGTEKCSVLSLQREDSAEFLVRRHTRPSVLSMGLNLKQQKHQTRAVQGIERTEK